MEKGHLISDRFEILAVKWNNGFYTVYAAKDMRTGRICQAVEFLYPSADKNLMKKNEILFLAAMKHSCAPKILDVISNNESVIWVRECLTGDNIQALIEKKKKKDPESHGAQPPEAVVSWTKQICSLCLYLERKQPPFLLLDVNPLHLLLVEKKTDKSDIAKYPFGRIVLTDWYMVRACDKDKTFRTDSFLGGYNRGYAAPEQFGGRERKLDVRTTIYQIGVFMYHMLTGYTPSETDYTIHPIGDYSPSLAGIRIETIVSKCCRVNPKERFQSISELKEALRIPFDPVPFFGLKKLKRMHIAHKLLGKLPVKKGKNSTSPYGMDYCIPGIPGNFPGRDFVYPTAKHSDSNVDYCMSCGKRNDTHGSICMGCGASMSWEVDQGATIGLCHCGNSFPLSSLYCPYCGRKIRE